MLTTPLDPSRLDRFSIPSLALMQSRKDIRDLADRRWAAVEARLRAEGAADRAALGMADPTPALPFIREAAGIGAFAAAFQTFVEDFARSFNAGWNTVRPQDRR